MSEPAEWTIDGEEFLLNPIEIEDHHVGISESLTSSNEVLSPAKEDQAPPTPERIIEAMLFVGGAPITIDHVQQSIRGLDEDDVRELIHRIAKRYLQQKRPYGIVNRSDGYALVLKSAFGRLREKLVSGPREVRLSQSSLDLLSLIAYRQPISRNDLESIRGSDCGSVLRQLVRLGLIAVSRRGEADTVNSYITTNRFLDLFQIASLDELPRLGESQVQV